MSVTSIQEKRIKITAGTLTAVVWIVALLWWFSGDPTSDFVVHGPGLDDPHGLKARLMAERQSVGIGQYIDRFPGIASDLSGRWPRFRGPALNNKHPDSVPLADFWPEDGPPVLWSLELGEGHAGAAVSKGRVYIMDYMEEERRDALRCFSMDDGREMWRRSYDVHVKRNHGMSRTVPAVTDSYVVTIGPMCHVMCVGATFGELLWGIDMVGEYGTKVPGWYAGQCPLVEEDLAILAPAGSNVLMMAVSCKTGDVVWQTPNEGRWNMSHSSVTPMTVNGKKMYVYAGVGGVGGVSAEGEDRGTMLWSTSDWTPSVIAPSPVSLGDGRLFCTAGYGAGSVMLKVTDSGGQFAVETLYMHKPKDGLACEQQIPLYYDGHLFAIMPKDGRAIRKQFVCAHPDGEIVWTSGKTARFGIGPFVMADGKFLIMDDDGVLTMAKAQVSGYEQLAQAQVLQGHDSWAPPALVSGRLLVRDSKQMVCLDLRDGR